MPAIQSKIKIIHKDATGKTNSESYDVNPEKINVNMDSDTATALDTWVRGLVTLSTDTYQDSEISQTVSLNEIMAE